MSKCFQIVYSQCIKLKYFAKNRPKLKSTVSDAFAYGVESLFLSYKILNIPKQNANWTIEYSENGRFAGCELKELQKWIKKKSLEFQKKLWNFVEKIDWEGKKKNKKKKICEKHK